MSIYLRNVFRFILLIVIQVSLLNKISLRWWSGPAGIPSYTPYIYPLFILLLPFATPVWFLLLSSFALGLSVDMFMNTGGMHAAACVLMALMRTMVLEGLLPKRIGEFKTMSPNIKSMGWTPFMTYAGILFTIHLVFFYILEIWSFHSFGYMFLKILISLITSLLFVALYSLLFSSSINSVYYDKQ